MGPVSRPDIGGCWSGVTDARANWATSAATQLDGLRWRFWCGIAGRRWTVEESFQTAKGLAGLDKHQVRTWTSWYRRTTSALVANLFMAITTAAERASPAPAG